MMRSRNYALLLALALVVACADSSSLPGDASATDATDAAPDGECEAECPEPRPIDLLLVLQDQTALDEMVDRVLTAMPRALIDATRGSERPLHFGVVTGDMGVGGFDVPGCDGMGDDGVLRSTETCPDKYVSVDSTSDTAEIRENLSCRLSGDDCGFEQPLEAMLKAVTSSSASISFHAGAGHSDGANSGFFRRDASLAVVVVVGEDDCSARDLGLYDPDSSEYDAPMTVRCIAHPDALYPTARYVDGLLAARTADNLGFFVLGGIPPALDGSGSAELLDSPEMQPRRNPDDPRQPALSCNEPGLPAMTPPKRLVEVASSLANQGVATGARSACQDSYLEPIHQLSRLLTRASCGCP